MSATRRCSSSRQTSGSSPTRRSDGCSRASLWRLSAMPTRRMYQDIDLVLISDLHLMTHCDVASLRKVGTDVTILVPAGGGQWLTNQGFSHVIEVSYGDVYVDDGSTVRAVPASHSGRRRGGPTGVALGYIVGAGEAPPTSPGTPTCSTGCRRSRATWMLPFCRCGVGDRTSAQDTSTRSVLQRRSPSLDHGSRCPSTGAPSCRWASRRSIDAGSRRRGRSSVSTCAASACLLRSPSRSPVTW